VPRAPDPVESPEPQAKEAGHSGDARREVARGVFLSGLSRLGAVIEVVSQPLLIWLFGIATYGLYASLWAGIVLLSTVADLGMTSALQRLVPQLEPEPAQQAVKLALGVGVGAAVAIALVISLEAERIAPFLSAAAADRAELPVALALFAWALPLWMFIEIATAAARARRAFGPEIRLRILWEQVARMVFAIGLAAAGVGTLGLMIAHLASLAFTALLCLPLLSRFYDLRGLARARIGWPLLRTLLATGGALLASNVTRRLLIHGPALSLNLLLPGAGGAKAAGLFEVARRISTVPYLVRQSFEYVLAPLAAAGAKERPGVVNSLYHFATNVTAALVLPLAALLIFAARDVLSVYRPEVIAALPILVILVVGRALEALTGPAQTVVEMTGSRALPLLNSLVALTAWGAVAAWLVPDRGSMGMAVAVAGATALAGLCAVLELLLGGARPGPAAITFPAGFVLRGALLSSIGAATMALAAFVLPGPLRVASLVLLWAGTSWLALRAGLSREDKAALGRLSLRLRL
jgi:O-antigen/teichoic acid export membrane protein